VIQARNPIRADLDRILPQPLARPPIERRAVGTRDDIPAPRLEAKCEAGAVLAAPQRREPPIAPLPAVAIGAVKHRPAVAVFEAGDHRQVIHHTGREQEKARVLLAVGAERDAEVIPCLSRRGHAGRPHHHAIGVQLAATKVVEFGRCNGVAGEYSRAAPASGDCAAGPNRTEAHGARTGRA